MIKTLLLCAFVSIPHSQSESKETAMLPAIRTLAAYNTLAFNKLWESILTLDEDQFAREFNYSRGSVARQVVHAAAAQGRWRRGFENAPDARSFTPDLGELPGLADAHALWVAEDAAFRAFIDGLTEAALLQPGVAGMDRPLYELLLHVLNHGTDHRSQTLRLLHELGAETFEQDLVFFLNEIERGNSASAN